MFEYVYIDWIILDLIDGPALCPQYWMIKALGLLGKVTIQIVVEDTFHHKIT